MSTSLQPYRERARAHQAAIDLAIVYLTPNDLKSRFKLSLSTIRDIPRDQLPYKEFGNGAKYKRRRYHPLDVLEYENRDRRQAVSA